MDMYSSNSGVPGLAATPSLSYSALHDPLALPDFCDFEGKNDLMDCGFGFNFPELNSFGGLDLDKLDQLVRMEADLERIERLERLEVEVGSLDSEGEVAYPPNLIGPSLGLSGWAPSDSSVESSLSHGCSVAAAMDSDSTDVVVNPLSVLPVSSSSSLNGGWSALLQQQQQQPQQQVAQAQTVNVPSAMPASPAPQGSPVSFPQRVAKSAPSSQSSSASAEPASGYPKPAYSYSCLIALALKNSRTGCLPVSEIYRFMCEHFPYFRTAPAGWKNSVRHNLSLNKCFEKVEKVSTTNGGGASNGGAQTNNTSASTRKGCLWTLSAAKAAKMDEEVLKWSRKDPIAIKRAMAYPDALELLERGEMKMDSVGGASTESEDEGEGPEEEAECHSPLTRVTPPEPSPPFDDVKSSSSSDKEQLNLGVSIVSRLAPPITGRRPSVQGSKQPKVYYSLPKFQTSGSELIIIGDARLESV